MTVRKKILDSRDGRDKIDLSRELVTVRAAISTLTDGENDMQSGAQEPGTAGAETPGTPAANAAPKATPKKKPAVKKKASTVKKKASTVKKKVKTAAAPASDKVTLAALCKTAKVNPRAMRRKLREAGVKNPGRWTWAKGSVPKTVENLLKEAGAK